MSTLFYTLGSAVMASSFFSFVVWIITWARYGYIFEDYPYEKYNSSIIWPLIATSMLDLNIVLSQDLTWNTIISAPVIGITCAIIGSIMNLSIAYLNSFRVKYAQSRLLKLLEVFTIATLTVTLAFLIPYQYSNAGYCAQGYGNVYSSWESQVHPVYLTCPNNTFYPLDRYSPLGTVLINSNSIVLADFAATYQLNSNSLPGVQIPSGQLAVFIVFWLVFTTLTYGTSIPTGLFQPCMVIGFSIGALYQNLCVTYFEVADNNVNVFPLLFASAAMITSLTGLSYSIIVLFLEVANFSNLVIPMVACVMISRGLTSLLTKSTYNCELRQQ